MARGDDPPFIAAADPGCWSQGRGPGALYRGSAHHQETHLAAGRTACTPDGANGVSRRVPAQCSLATLLDLCGGSQEHMRSISAIMNSQSVVPPARMSSVCRGKLLRGNLALICGANRAPARPLHWSPVMSDRPRERGLLRCAGEPRRCVRQIEFAAGVTVSVRLIDKECGLRLSKLIAGPPP